MKKGDYIVFAAIVLLSGVLLAVSLSGKSGKSIEISCDNKHYKSYPLNKNGEYKIKTQGGENTLIIEDGHACFKNSDCPDKTCEKMGKISKAGDSIVCLPHRVVAEVED